MSELAPENLHARLLERAPRILRFDPDAYFPEWQSAVRRSFKQLLGLMPARVPLNLQIIEDVPAVGEPLHRSIQFIFTAETGVDVPCTLVTPTAVGPFPIVICLQGHRWPAYASLGESREPGDEAAASEGMDFATQALHRGYAALVMDMRCFGDRRDQRAPAQRQGYASGCHHASMTALLLGRTMIGERVWDITRAIDALAEHFPMIDPSRIALLGFSAGAAVAFYAAAFDPRIAAVICSGAVSSYASSIGTINHCADNYIPNILHYFDMSDLAGLIVPRPLIIVSGEADPLYPIAGVRECFAEIAEIYAHENAPRACRLVAAPGGHHSYPNLFWPAFEEVVAGPTA